jgi:hypothetical protein
MSPPAGVCPQGWEWLQCEGGYVCAGGNHYFNSRGEDDAAEYEREYNELLAALVAQGCCLTWENYDELTSEFIERFRRRRAQREELAEEFYDNLLAWADAHPCEGIPDFLNQRQDNLLQLARQREQEQRRDMEFERERREQMGRIQATRNANSSSSPSVRVPPQQAYRAPAQQTPRQAPRVHQPARVSPHYNRPSTPPTAEERQKAAEKARLAALPSAEEHERQQAAKKASTNARLASAAQHSTSVQQPASRPAPRVQQTTPRPTARTQQPGPAIKDDFKKQQAEAFARINAVHQAPAGTRPASRPAPRAIQPGPPVTNDFERERAEALKRINAVKQAPAVSSSSTHRTTRTVPAPAQTSSQPAPPMQTAEEWEKQRAAERAQKTRTATAGQTLVSRVPASGSTQPAASSRDSYQQRRDEEMEQNFRREQMEALARIRAVHAAAPAPPSAQNTLPAPQQQSLPLRTANPARSQNALPAPDQQGTPAWERGNATPAAASRERVPVSAQTGGPQNKQEKMPWE